MAVAFRDRAVLLGRTLVLADLHLGREAASNVSIPLGERADVVDRLDALLARYEPREVVVAGDVLHAFGTIPDGVREAFDAIAALVEAVGARLVVTPGNHDALLSEVWAGPAPVEYAPVVPCRREDGESPSGSQRDGETVVCHGHEPPGTDAATYVVGHDHPAITIEGRRRPCYLYGEAIHEGADVLMLPAFNRLTAGTVVNGMRSGDFQSPLVSDADALRPIVRDEDADETLTFPPLGRFRRML